MNLFATANSHDPFLSDPPQVEPSLAWNPLVLAGVGLPGAGAAPRDLSPAPAKHWASDSAARLYDGIHGSLAAAVRPQKSFPTSKPP